MTTIISLNQALEILEKQGYAVEITTNEIVDLIKNENRKEYENRKILDAVADIAPYWAIQSVCASNYYRIREGETSTPQEVLETHGYGSVKIVDSDDNLIEEGSEQTDFTFFWNEKLEVYEIYSDSDDFSGIKFKFDFQAMFEVDVYIDDTKYTTIAFDDYEEAVDWIENDYHEADFYNNLPKGSTFRLELILNKIYPNLNKPERKVLVKFAMNNSKVEELN